MQKVLRLVHRSNETSFAVDTTSQCPALSLAYSERSINAATLFLAYSEHSINAASEKVTAEQEDTEAVCLGGPGSQASAGRLGPGGHFGFLPAASEFVTSSAVQRGLQHIRVLGLAAQCLLLSHLLGLGSVPVGLNLLIVPHN